MRIVFWDACECSESMLAGLRQSIEIVSFRPLIAIAKCLLVLLMMGNGLSYDGCSGLRVPSCMQ